MKEILKYKKGITLIALVVTIIVLLILAGVSISMLTGSNGILTQAQTAKEKTEIASEEEAVQLTMINKEMTDDEKYDIGRKLYSRTVTNGNRWSIIITKDPRISYGDNWRYIGKGTDLSDYGVTQYNWLYNDETGEILRLEDDNYIELAYGSNLAVTEGLVFNLDPLNMEDEESWGDAKLYGFSGTETDEDGNVISGFSGSDFNFDGVDDYIEINSDADFSEDGITIETYGVLNENSFLLGEVYKGPREGTNEAFKYGVGNQPCFSELQNVYFQVSGTFYQGISTGTNYQCRYASNDFHIPLNDDIYQGEAYVTFSLKDDGSFFILLDGKKVVEDKFNSDYVGHYKEYLANKNYPIIIGASSIGEGLFNIKMKTYAIRIYNKTLTEEEAYGNYEKTVASRALFESE